AFDEDAFAVGAVLAAHGAVAMKMSRDVEHLNLALQSRATIEQAKGIIMATMRCSPDRAFEVLRQQSQALNEKLRDIAAEIVDRQAPG
ncbi:MAG TPA: ANTAR domain-containing protein, partial [Acidimicrobiales bacterium]|nr:ANTAR domain-containing protein [Acidimicrobiales bacterium]